MGIFSSIKNAIFGTKDEPEAVDATTTAGETPGKPMSAVDVDQVMTAKAAAHGEDLNWRSSIVDLMKLLGIDASLSNRKELAQELGYTGALDGSAEMNIWLHKAVMRELAKNGGQVPADLTD